MPSLGADMETGTLVEWRVAPGAHVQRGEVVALVETVKGIIDVESFEDGIVERLIVEPGTLVPVGTPLALLEGEATPTAAGPAPLAAAPSAAASSPPRAGTEAAVPAPAPLPRAAAIEPAAPPAKPAARPMRVSPAARARAAALRVDLSTVQGSGPHGVITLEDVERRVAAQTCTPAATPTSATAPARVETHTAMKVDTEQASALAPATAATPAPARAPTPPQAPGAMRAGIRTAIAASMSRSKREIPHYYLQLAMDFQPAASWLEAFNQARAVPDRVLTAVLLIKAAARAAAEKRGFNGYFGERGFEPAASVHMGVAIALRGGGLVAPAIFDADRKPITALMRELQDLVARVRAGHMRSSEISSATLTVTSLGDEGVDTLYPIIYPPQVAIIGFGSVTERPWVVDHRLEVRPVLNVTLAADHRVTDGRQGAQFLARIRDLLAQPGDL
jgi:pyruvate dehydrogenase E2 component (dihydrolipoamide acetyltransferase)